MALPTLRKQGGGTEENFRAQTNVDVVVQNLKGSLILDGTLLENVSISTSGTAVDHKLGREYRGYIICGNDTFSNLKIVSSTNKKLFINLQASVNCTVTLWVF